MAGDTAGDGRMPLMEHLNELRSRLIKCAPRRAASGCSSVSSPTTGSSTSSSIRTSAGRRPRPGVRLFVHRPARGVLGPPEGVRPTAVSPSPCRCSSGSCGGSSRPGSTPRAALRHPVRRLGARALRSSAPGIAYWTLPSALEFLSNVGGENLIEIYSPNKYFQLIVYMMLAFGIGFEFPIVLLVPPARRHPHARDLGGVPALRHRRHRRARRRHHAVRRPDQHARAHRPDVPVLRGVDRRRSHPDSAEAAAASSGA